MRVVLDRKRKRQRKGRPNAGGQLGQAGKAQGNMKPNQKAKKDMQQQKSLPPKMSNHRGKQQRSSKQQVKLVSKNGTKMPIQQIQKHHRVKRVIMAGAAGIAIVCIVLVIIVYVLLLMFTPLGKRG